MTTTPRWIAITAGILGFTGVALGAFGAHALKDTLIARDSLNTWQTAVLYHLIHSLALLAIIQNPAGGSKITAWTARCWALGIVLFSGSLYWLSLGGPRSLGPITPIGGLGFLLGWSLVVWNALQPART